jgi:hypothetical protein
MCLSRGCGTLLNGVNDHSPEKWLRSHRSKFVVLEPYSPILHPRRINSLEPFLFEIFSHNPAYVLVSSRKPLFHIDIPASGFAATATLRQYPTLFLKALKASVLRFFAPEIDVVIRSRMRRTSLACSVCFSSLGSHKEAAAARISRKFPWLQRSISLRSPLISVSPRRWRPIATPSRTRQRVSEAGSEYLKGARIALREELTHAHDAAYSQKLKL